MNLMAVPYHHLAVLNRCYSQVPQLPLQLLSHHLELSDQEDRRHCSYTSSVRQTGIRTGLQPTVFQTTVLQATVFNTTVLQATVFNITVLHVQTMTHTGFYLTPQKPVAHLCPCWRKVGSLEWSLNWFVSFSAGLPCTPPSFPLPACVRRSNPSG